MRAHAQRDSRKETREKQAQSFITIAVSIEGLPQFAKNKPIVIRCCEGNQRIKWLSLTVSQRCCGQKPSGARRSNEHWNIPAGFVVPGEVLNYNPDDPTSSTVIDPTLCIKDVFKPGFNECIVRLGSDFGRDYLAKQRISAFGVPSNYLSPFAQRAFYSTTATKLQNYDALKERVEKNEEEQRSLVTRWELSHAQRHKTTRQDVEVSKFRMVMLDQSGFGGDYEHQQGGMGVLGVVEQAIVLNQAVEVAFQQMSMCRLGQIPADEQKSLKHTVNHWLDMVDNAFKFYSGMYSIGMPINTHAQFRYLQY
jgi:hypothetical protein